MNESWYSEGGFLPSGLQAVTNDTGEPIVISPASQVGLVHVSPWRQPLPSFLDAIAGPLATTLRAAADWLDGDPQEPTEEAPAPRWQMNDRGGFDPIEE